MPSNETTLPPEVAKRYARRDDGPNSREAAAGISERELTELQAAICELLRAEGPMTDERIYQRYVAAGLPHRTPQRVRTARAEITEGAKHLRDVARIRPSGEVGETASGYHGDRWELIPVDEVPC